MNQQGLGRPPSYSYQNVAGRPQSPMPPPGQQQMSHHPPPIDTRQGYVGQQPQLQQQPPGYAGGGYGQLPQVPQPAMGQYGPNPLRPAEVDGGNRSKAQLIVGIDFVSLHRRRITSKKFSC